MVYEDSTFTVFVVVKNPCLAPNVSMCAGVP
jgi:hypothetical protein